MRRDAQRNRDRLVAAAREVFAARGLGVPLDEVARGAGVSIGTLYNRFPTRGALIDAVFRDRGELVEQLARTALEDPDAWAGFVRFVEGGCELQAADRGYNDVASRRLLGAPIADDARARHLRLMRRIVTRAQRAGALRADVTVEDLAFLVWGTARTVEATAAVAPDAWRRHLAIMLDGMRVGAPQPLPGAPLTQAQVAAAMRDPGG